jgi:hypothetical protein
LAIYLEATLELIGKIFSTFVGKMNRVVVVNVVVVNVVVVAAVVVVAVCTKRVVRSR